MSLSAKKKKAEAKSALAAKSARSAGKDAGAAISEQASDLAQRAAEYLGQAQDWAEPRVRDAVGASKHTYDKARRETVKYAAPKLEAAADAVRPKVDQAYEAISADYLPRIQKAMHDAAKAANSTKGLDKKAKKASAAAQKALSKKQNKGSAGKTFGWILVGSVAAGAGYLLWRRTQPIEDPWAEEYWNDSEATAPLAGAADTSSDESKLAEKAKDAVDNAKSSAKKAADAVGTKADELKSKATGSGEAAGAHGVGANGNLKADKDTAKDLKNATPSGSLGDTPKDLNNPDKSGALADELGEVRSDSKHKK